MPEEDRYRRAAESALEQLDWCAEYLRRIGRHGLSRRLARNRRAIARRLGEEGNRRRTGGRQRPSRSRPG
jgi:hypothetical protein